MLEGFGAVVRRDRREAEYWRQRDREEAARARYEREGTRAAHEAWQEENRALCAASDALLASRDEIDELNGRGGRP